MLYQSGTVIPSKDATKEVLGGKGYGLYRMSSQGIPVPPFFIIGTADCLAYQKDPAAKMEQVRNEYIPAIIKGLTDHFGYMPLVAVRSGAKDSMPGMMDTVLNVGLDDDSIKAWYERIGKDCAHNSRLRLVEMFGNVVAGIERKEFEGKDIAERFRLYKEKTGGYFPNAAQQLEQAIEAVFKSWNNERAIEYRNIHKISHDGGTAVVVQAMVFGNFNDKSCTGVAFSRNYSNGANEITGDWLPNAQGEDIVAGIRNAFPLSELPKWNRKVAKELGALLVKLEQAEGDMVDTEFTVQDGKLYMLQVRKGKRTALAAVKIALDMRAEGSITDHDVIERVSLKQLLAASRPTVPAAWLGVNPAHGTGVAASNGVVSGVAVFSSKDAVNCKVPCILIAEETTPDDIAGMNAAVGILTSTGGATCHAAVVARGMDKVCVVGCTELKESSGAWELKGHKIKEGTKVTIDGTTGAVWVGVDVPVQGGADSGLVSEFMNKLFSVYPLYRVCTTAEEIAGAQKVLVSTFMLDREGGDWMPKCKAMFKALAGKDAVVDMRGMDKVCREADQPLEFIWGAIKDVTLAKMQLLHDSGANAKVLELGLEPKQIEHAKKLGLETVPMVDTLEALIEVNGICMADFAKLTSVNSKEAILSLIKLKGKAGEALRSFNIVPEVEADKLSRSALFALSGMQAAQSLLRPE